MFESSQGHADVHQGIAQGGNMSQVSIFDSGNFLLGEGPHWSTSLQALCWVDILDNAVIMKSATERKQFSNFFQPSAVTSSTATTIEVVDAEGVWTLELGSGSKTLKFSIPQGHPNNRSNESARDARGNIWIGRMNRDDSLRTGELLCISPTGELNIAVPDMGIPNTLLWDESRDRMYFADSSERSIYVVAIVDGVPDFSTRCTLSLLDESFGAPDGSAITAAGNIFNARWGAGSVLEMNPAGEVIRNIELPTTYITSCSLNDDESVLYVTSACVPIPEADRTANDGAVFAVEL